MDQVHNIVKRNAGSPYLGNRGGRGLAVSIVFTALASFIVSIRIYTRKTIMRRMEPNDWMILVALIFSFIFMGFYIDEARHGMGMHGADIPPEVMKKQMKAFWLTIPFYNAAVLCAKASILMQYFRVFATRNMRIICMVMIGVLGTYGTWCVISAFLNCIPLAKFWDPSIPGHCLSKTGLWFSNAAMHITTDVAILLIPTPGLAALKLPMKQKIALIAIFALGGFVCVTSICRLVSLQQIAYSDDPTYDNVGAASWSAVECNVGIVCACLPTLRPLVARLFPRLLSSFGTSPVDGNGRMSRGEALRIGDSTRSATPSTENAGDVKAWTMQV